MIQIFIDIDKNKTKYQFETVRMSTSYEVICPNSILALNNIFEQ